MGSWLSFRKPAKAGDADAQLFSVAQSAVSLRIVSVLLAMGWILPFTRASLLGRSTLTFRSGFSQLPLTVHPGTLATVIALFCKLLSIW